ncbi:AcvB/VirJ family lysyl-phosphatidylglycerol hydrolase [Sphingobium sp. AN558]|uniref:AcvB/VirJ family lysyl-phosphatidylglycerol hydrolase n=1 Tax=Sphingobium sp. AN558 TaxID=3133442 RepID=UPI0030BFE4A1
MGKRIKITILSVLSLPAALVGVAAYLGYFGGPVFVDIPATARPAKINAGLAAVVLSGDMGFRIGMGPRVANRLAADGIPVVGINSLTFFRNRRSPAEVKALISAAARRALAFGHAGRVVLIGQSFGADMLHIGLTGMAPALRAHVAMVALVVPTDTILYRASPSELLNWTRPDAAALPTARQLTWVPVTCIQGAEETDSLCPMLTQPNVHRVALPGGHPMHGDTDAVHAVLAKAIAAANITGR